MNTTLEYLIVNIKIMLLNIKEYKTNSIIQILTQIIYFYTYFLFFDILSSVIPQSIYSKMELLLYLIIIDMCVTFSGIFDWGKSLKNTLVTGHLNLYLTKPKNIFYLYQLSNMNSNALTQHITAWCIILILHLNTTLLLKVDILFICLILLVLLYYITIRLFCSSIAFFNYELSEMLYSQFLKSGSSTFKTYPAQFFEHMPFKRILFIFPLYFMGMIAFEYFFFNQFEIKLLILLLILISIFSLATLLFWKTGLKKYEAFG